MYGSAVRGTTEAVLRKKKCYAILDYTVLYHTIPYYTILYYTILLYTILDRGHAAEEEVRPAEGPRAARGRWPLGSLSRYERDAIRYDMI